VEFQLKDAVSYAIIAHNALKKFQSFHRARKTAVIAQKLQRVACNKLHMKQRHNSRFTPLDTPELDRRVESRGRRAVLIGYYSVHDIRSNSLFNSHSKSRLSQPSFSAHRQ